ncbi:hypothetical protein [Kochikohdavirus PBEF19]|uniref:Uncharacterized protein n=1 Tax=Enterococcus phage PBEF129 TaxID=2696337 RepID=A0A7T3MKM6_9CAUD|nr:hypothetical protein [Enterococcus phage PBEF129]
MPCQLVLLFNAVKIVLLFATVKLNDPLVSTLLRFVKYVQWASLLNVGLSLLATQAVRLCLNVELCLFIVIGKFPGKFNVGTGFNELLLGILFRSTEKLGIVIVP